MGKEMTGWATRRPDSHGPMLGEHETSSSLSCVWGCGTRAQIPVWKPLPQRLPPCLQPPAFAHVVGWLWLWTTGLSTPDLATPRASWHSGCDRQSPPT